MRSGCFLMYFLRPLRECLAHTSLVWSLKRGGTALLPCVSPCSDVQISVHSKEAETHFHEFAHRPVLFRLPPIIKFLETSKYERVAIVCISRSIWLLGLLEFRRKLSWGRLLGVFFETDRKSRNWVFDLYRELGLAWYGLGWDVLMLRRGLLLGWLLLVMDRMEVMLNWLLKSKVPKTEMLETHANKIATYFCPWCYISGDKMSCNRFVRLFWDEIGTIFPPVHKVTIVTSSHWN